MEPKGGSSAVAVTAAEVKEALARRPDLSATEENVVRMRYGAKVGDLKAPLPQAHGGNEELKDELLLLEMQLLRGYRKHRAAALPALQNRIPPAVPPPVEVDGRAKDKIVRALRKKKDR